MLRTLYDVLNNHGLTLTAMIQRLLLNHENENATVFTYALENTVAFTWNRKKKKYRKAVVGDFL
jgi:hypothetical protein